MPVAGQIVAAAVLTLVAVPARQLDAPAGADASDAAYRPKALLPFMKRLPARRVVRPWRCRVPEERLCAARRRSCHAPHARRPWWDINW